MKSSQALGHAALVFAVTILFSTRVSHADDSSTSGPSAASSSSSPLISEATVPRVEVKEAASSVDGAAQPSVLATTSGSAKTENAPAAQPVTQPIDVKSDPKMKDVEAELADAEKTLAEQQAQSKQDKDDAERTAREELAQAQAMADAKLAAQAASTPASTASSSDETAVEQAIDGGTGSSSTSTTATDSHYSMTGLVDMPHGIGMNPSDSSHHSMGELSDSHALAPDASDTKHHSMDELVNF